MIRDIRLTEMIGDINDEESYFPENDIFDCYLTTQFARVFHRPLMTEEPKDRNFFSFRGRAVCLLKFTQNFFREPWKLVKSIAVIVAVTALGILGLLNLPFLADKSDAFIYPVIPLAMLGGAVVRPFAFVSDQVKLLAGMIIHPNIAINTVE